MNLSACRIESSDRWDACCIYRCCVSIGSYDIGGEVSSDGKGYIILAGGSVNVWVGFCSVDVCPSPKFQR